MTLPSYNPCRKTGRSGVDFASWCCSAAAGDFAEAWRVNDRTGQHWPSAHQLWNGESPDGRSLTVHFYHGLGDAVQMLQYAPLLRAHGVCATFDVQGPLLPLLPYFKAASTRHTPQPDPRPLQIEAMELPYLFRMSSQHLPLAQRYLQLPGHTTADTKARMGLRTRPRVGLVWTGSDWDRDRWVPGQCLHPLCEDGRLEIWNLQEHPHRNLDAPQGMRDASALCGSGVLALAATIANLDVLVTVDTLAAHLAGALGIPTCLLLKHEADWRWMTGSSTPWYPSLKLFRQKTAGKWGPVVEQVRRTLPGMLGYPTHRGLPHAISHSGNASLCLRNLDR